MDQVKDFLEHHGIKGQKWGIRNKSLKIKTKAISTFESKKKKSLRAKTASLSDEELAKALKRMNMEQQYINLSTKSSAKKSGQSFVKDIGKTAVKTALTAVVTHHVTKGFNKTRVLKIPDKK